MDCRLCALLPVMGHEHWRVRDGIACSVFVDKVLYGLLRFELFERGADLFTALAARDIQELMISSRWGVMR